VHNWADLQSVHGFRCYDNIYANAKCQRVLVLALYLVVFVSLLLSPRADNGSVSQWVMMGRQMWTGHVGRGCL